MRNILFLSLGLWLALAPATRAADTDPQALIDRAIKAFGAENLDDKTGQTKSKGTLDVMGGIPFTQEVTYLLPDKFKEVMDLEVAGQKIAVTTVYNGDKAWINTNGNTQELDGKLLGEMKEAGNLLKVSRLLKLKAKDEYTLSLLGESKVNNQPADGVKISTKGFRDVNIYFDRKTGLTAKIERTAFDAMTQQEVNEERIILEYQELEGRKVPKKVQVNRNGKKFLDVEVVEYKFSPKVEASEFDKP